MQGLICAHDIGTMLEQRLGKRSTKTPKTTGDCVRSANAFESSEKRCLTNDGPLVQAEQALAEGFDSFVHSGWRHSKR